MKVASILSVIAISAGLTYGQTSTGGDSGDRVRDTGEGFELHLIARPYATGIGTAYTTSFGSMFASVGIAGQFLPYHSSAFCYTYNPNAQSPARISRTASPSSSVVGFEGKAFIQSAVTVDFALKKLIGSSKWYLKSAAEYSLLNWNSKFSDTPIEESTGFFGNCGQEFEIAVLPWEEQIIFSNSSTLEVSQKALQHFLGLNLGFGKQLSGANPTLSRFFVELDFVYLFVLQTKEFTPHPEVNAGREIIGSILPKRIRYGLQMKVGFRL